MEDARIVELYLAREEQAIVHTREKYGPSLRALARNLLEDPLTAEECENDTYLRAWQSIPPHAPRDHLFAFLARICRHLTLDRARKRAAQKRPAALTSLTDELAQCLSAPDDTESRVEARLLAQAVSAYLRSLPEKQRVVFLRRYWYLDPIGDIARRMGMTPGGVKTALWRCRVGLREHLKKEGFDL